MDHRYIRHPIRTYQQWKEKERYKCVVQIDYPRMKIKGRAMLNSLDQPEFKLFYAFFGIPYAQSPIGPLRFQPPQPLPPTSTWRTPLFRAYNMENACIQHFNEVGKYIGTEDCLCLNIYLLQKPAEMIIKRPVLVYIHGGGFHHGSGDISDIRPNAIIREDIVFVTVNYRLNLFGFLNMRNEECRGNVGLKDQTAALRWVKANIDKFGGDPNNVTISGHSAGATCVNLHLISPLSKGLFHKAIIKAGGLNCPWGYQGNNARPQILFTRQFAQSNNFRSTVVAAMMSLTACNLLDITLGITENALAVQEKRLQVFCGPSLECGMDDAFIPREVHELKMMAEPVPLIAGITSHEGYMYILAKWEKYGERGFDELIKNDDQFIDFLKQNLSWSDLTACKHMDTIRRMYFPDLETLTSEKIEHHLQNLCTDIWFRHFYDNFKLGPSQKFPWPFYVYQFRYLAPNTELRWTLCGRAKLRIRGPSHGDEQRFLYKPVYLMEKCGDRFLPDVDPVVRHMCSMWGNFCRKGIPRSDHEKIWWRPHMEGDPSFLSIGKQSNLVRTNLFQRRWERLNEIVDHEPRAETPLPPYQQIPSIFDPFPTITEKPWRMIDSSDGEAEEASPARPPNAPM